MTATPNYTKIKDRKEAIWSMINTLEQAPRYPAILRRVDFTARDEEYIDHQLSYEEKYDEELQLREGFIIAALEERRQLLGVGDCVILDLGKRTLLRAPRVARCGLVLPMLSYQGSIQQPQDYITYFDLMQEAIQRYAASLQKRTLRCPQMSDGSRSQPQE
jgi:hypothetical protein